MEPGNKLTYRYINSKIAPGYNNSGGLQTWEAITPAGSIPFIAPVVYGSYLLGKEQVNTDGTYYYSGFASTKPVFGYVTQEQFYYIYHTLNSDSFWSKVTAELRFINPSVYGIFNTILKIEQLQSQTKKGMAFDQFKVTYTRLDQIA
jgi:hypothetical protein